jgi:hypothetical protein
MGLMPSEPPAGLVDELVAHVQRLAHPPTSASILRDAGTDRLVLTAPHRAYVLPADAIAQAGLEGARFVGWRFLLMEDERVIAAVQTAGEQVRTPSLNAGPFVGATAAAINSLESLSEVARGEFELRLLTVPALYAAAAWLVGERTLVVPLAPTPACLRAGEPYTEQSFLDAIREPARSALAAANDMRPTQQEGP